MNKKIFISLSILCFLGACGAPTAMLGPAYTLTSTGNVTQAGLSYGSNHLITSYTGKTPIENLEEITSKNIPKKNIIQKKGIKGRPDYLSYNKKNYTISEDLDKSDITLEKALEIIKKNKKT